MLRTSPRRLLVLGLVVALALVLAAGCGGGSSDNPPKPRPGAQLTLQQYFDQLKSLRDQYEKRLEAAATPSTLSLGNAQEAAKMYEELIGSSTQALSDLLDAMRSMNPPPEVRHAHEALLQAGPVYLQSLRDYTGWLANASADSQPPSDTKGEAALGTITDACNELLRVASGNGIYAPYIECGGEAGIGFGSSCASPAAAAAPCATARARNPGPGH